MTDKQKKFLKNILNYVQYTDDSFAHNYISSSLKEAFPEVFEEELPQKGWVVNVANSAIGFKDGICIPYGFDGLCKWVDNTPINIQGYERYWRKATEDEVKDALLKEAKERYGDNVVLNLYSSYNGVLDYNSSSLYSSGDFWIRIKSKDKDCKVFDNGKWADVEESPLEVTMSEVESKFGRKVKIVK